jgi:hypothetical protein
LLTATLFHAIRLERALGVLKRDRSALEALVASFNDSTQAAESGIQRLRATTDGVGRQIQRQIDTASTLKDDLTFLVQRGEGLADRLDDAVRATRAATNFFPREGTTAGFSAPAFAAPPSPRASYPTQDERAPRDEPKVRSQAERDLLKALRMVR